MNLQRIWQDKYLVNWYEADLTGLAKLSSICNYLQESAWRHANHLGFGFEDAQARNEVWVIIGLMLKMLRYPAWGETITVETWPKGIDRLFAFRDFRILDEQQNVIGAATSTWMILDSTTRRPRPVEIVRDVLHLAVRQDILDKNPPHLQPPHDPEILYSRQVRFSELDFNGHVNNTRYIDWCMDAFPAEWHLENKVNTLIINYLSEVRGTDTIALLNDRSSNSGYALQGNRESDGKAIFRARLEIE
jgi:medium-chain acyl-[acyl-carrier-protein] hydrolase